MVSALIGLVIHRLSIVQALKALVIIMGVMIIAAVVVIVVTIINRSRDMAQRARPYEAVVGAPPGELIDMTASGERVTLHYRLPDGGDRLIVIDTVRGRLRGTIDLEQP